MEAGVYFIFSNSYESLVGVGPLAMGRWGTDVGYEKSTVWGMGRYYDESIMCAQDTNTSFSDFIVYFLAHMLQ